MVHGSWVIDVIPIPVTQFREPATRRSMVARGLGRRGRRGGHRTVWNDQVEQTRQLPGHPKALEALEGLRKFKFAPSLDDIRCDSGHSIAFWSAWVLV